MPDSRAAAPAGFTILMIDDDAATRTIVRRALQHEGYVVLEAADGEVGDGASASWRTGQISP